MCSEWAVCHTSYKFKVNRILCWLFQSQDGNQKCSPWGPFPVRIERFTATHSMRCFLKCRFVCLLHSLNIMLYIACNMYCIIALVAFICILCYLISFYAVLRLESLSSGTFSGCVVRAPGRLLFGPPLRFQRGLSVPFLTRLQRVWNLSQVALCAHLGGCCLDSSHDFSVVWVSRSLHDFSVFGIYLRLCCARTWVVVVWASSHDFSVVWVSCSKHAKIA